MSQQAPDPDYLECFTDEADDSTHLRNLLAIIHGDGGHHTEAVGTAQSCRDAAAKWYRLGNDVAELEQLVKGNAAPPTVQPKQLQTFDHLFEGLLPEEEDP
jgi:alkanesulfonate monooxygenase SsuD/methylene tetrahydromethanopterin reductase-like flavin-dependent oxidoreductase (luciferase family)